MEVWKLADTHPTRTDDLPSIEQLIGFDSGGLLVADVGGVVVGTVIAGWDGWRGTIYRLAVVPEHRGQGVGRALVNAAVGSLQSRGAKRLIALVVKEDPGAMGFWAALKRDGFLLDPGTTRYVRNL